MEAFLQDVPSLLWSGVLLYVLAFFFSLCALLSHRAYLRTFFYTLLISGFFLQGYGLYHRGVTLGVFPSTETLETLQVISWSIVFLVLIIQLTARLRLLAFFANALAAALGLGSLLFLKLPEAGQHPITMNPWVEFHASLGVFAYAVFALLAVTSLMYVIQDFGLSHKRIGGFFQRLPALRQLDKASERLLLVGVVIMSVAILLGSLTWFGAMHLAAAYSVLPAWGVWLGYTALLIARLKTAISHIQMAWASLILFVIAMLALWPLLSGMLHS